MLGYEQFDIDNKEIDEAWLTTKGFHRTNRSKKPSNIWMEKDISGTGDMIISISPISGIAYLISPSYEEGDGRYELPLKKTHKDVEDLLFALEYR